jgi:hypothetical protein
MPCTPKPWRALIAGIIVTLGACDDDSLNAPRQQLDEVRAAVEPLNDLASAQAAGYDVLVVHPMNGNECLSDSQLGGMGFHYLKPALADSVLVATEPEVLIYEQAADDSVSFVAVEYVVPFAVRPETEPPPVLFGQEFKRNTTFGVWALHAWIGRDNPSGTFADFNPNVSCP